MAKHGMKLLSVSSALSAGMTLLTPLDMSSLEDLPPPLSPPSTVVPTVVSLFLLLLFETQSFTLSCLLTWLSQT